MTFCKVHGLFLWLGYQTADAVNDVFDWGLTCQSCLNIRENVRQCANVEIPYATARDQVLKIDGDPLLDPDCLCFQHHPSVYDECNRCAPVNAIKESIANIQGICQDVYSKAASNVLGSRPYIALSLARTLLASLAVLMH